MNTTMWNFFIENLSIGTNCCLWNRWNTH
jgi:hypothetical protein